MPCTKPQSSSWSKFCPMLCRLLRVRRRNFSSWDQASGTQGCHWFGLLPIVKSNTHSRDSVIPQCTSNIDHPYLKVIPLHWKQLFSPSIEWSASKSWYHLNINRPQMWNSSCQCSFLTLLFDSFRSSFRFSFLFAGSCAGVGSASTRIALAEILGDLGNLGSILEACFLRSTPQIGKQSSVT